MHLKFTNLIINTAVLTQVKKDFMEHIRTTILINIMESRVNYVIAAGLPTAPATPFSKVMEL